MYRRIQGLLRLCDRLRILSLCNQNFRGENLTKDRLECWTAFLVSKWLSGTLGSTGIRAVACVIIRNLLAPKGVAGLAMSTQSSAALVSAFLLLLVLPASRNLFSQEKTIPTRVNFVDVLEDSGIDFRHHFFPSEQGENYRMNQYDHGSGVLVADVNNDGRMDIYLLDFLGPNALYINKGNFKFEETARRAGVDLPEDVSVGGSFGDYDNDGDSDLYVTTYRTGNHLFRNRGDGTFEDVSKKAGVGHNGHSSAALWFDYDLDGNLDLYLSNIGPFTTAETSPDAAYARRGINLPLNYIVANPEADHGGEPDILFKNNGDGTFTDVTKQSGINSNQWNGDVSVGD